MSVQQNILPGSIPDTDFPVTWENPEDESLFWLHGRHMFPDPMTPLDFSYQQIMSRCADSASETYDIPMRAKHRHINTYYYLSVFQADPPGETEFRALEKLEAAIAEMGERWETEWLPEIRSHLDFWESFNLKEASLETIAKHLKETRHRTEQSWKIHFLLYYPMTLSVSLFEEMYRDLFSESGQSAPYSLLAGFRNKNIESGIAIWELSRQAAALPGVRETLAGNDAADVVEKLGDSAEDREFLKHLDQYLREYGKRSEKITLNIPFWAENPAPVIRNLQDYLTMPDKDLNAELSEAAEKREKDLADIRKQLQGYPETVKAKFETLLRAAQTGYALREDHDYWIDFQVKYYARQVFLESGTRLELAGALEKQDDVFYLTWDELDESIGKLPGVTDLRETVRDRRAAEERFSSVIPPPFIGAPPMVPPPDDPVTRAIMKIAGEPVPQTPDSPDEIRGHAGSPGIARGTARVVRSLSDTKLKPGDILVTETTSPSWTPVFATIAGVVTDSGGNLSHCAIVAREYGVPAVVGTGAATAMIRDGQTIEVDGHKGIVRIIQEP